MRSWEERRAPRLYLVAVVQWHGQRRRARREVYRADLDYRRTQTPARLERLNRAREHLALIDLNRPWIPRP